MKNSEKSTSEILDSLIEILTNFEQELIKPDLREKILALVPAHDLLSELGISLIPVTDAASARDRIILYLKKYLLTVINSKEIMIVAGISEWARRVRELRVECGWQILSGMTAKEMAEENELSATPFDYSGMHPDDYVLIDEEQDRDAAFRWKCANEIRKSDAAVRDKILKYLKMNVGITVNGEELRYVSKDRTEWARRVRELRTEFGWPIVSKSSGRPDLPIGVYLLEEDRQAPPHDRIIPDAVRSAALLRDNYKCQKCGWYQDLWDKSDPRHLELHHQKRHADGGENRIENLITLCTVCHDELHRNN